MARNTGVGQTFAAPPKDLPRVVVGFFPAPPSSCATVKPQRWLPSGLGRSAPLFFVEVVSGASGLLPGLVFEQLRGPALDVRRGSVAASALYRCPESPDA